MANSQFDPLFPRAADVLRVLFRHWRKSLCFSLLALAATVLALAVLPRKYCSEARLFVRLGRETVALDPTASTGPTISMIDSRESEIHSVAEMLESRDLLARVVDKVGAEAVLDHQATSAKADSSPSRFEAALDRVRTTTDYWLEQAQATLKKSGISDPIDPRERAIIRLGNDLQIHAGKKSSVIKVAVTAHSPQTAQKILNEYLAAYAEQHLRANRIAGSFEFFSEQAERLRDDVIDAKKSLRDAKNENSIVTFAGRQDTLQRELTTVESDLLEVDSALQSSEARVESLQQAHAKLPAQQVTEQTTGFPNEAADNMRQLLYSLEINVKDMLSRRTAAHPRVAAAQQQLEDAQKIMKNQEPEKTQTTLGLNPAHIQIHTRLLEEQSTVASLRAKKIALEAQLAQLHDHLRALNAQEVEISQLELESQRLESNYRTYWENREQARIDQLLQMERISNVNVVQPASFMPKPVSPKKPLVALLGLMFAVFGGLSLAFVSEYLDHSVKTPDEAERLLDVPVLVSIPNVRLRPPRLLVRSREHTRVSVS